MAEWCGPLEDFYVLGPITICELETVASAVLLSISLMAILAQGTRIALLHQLRLQGRLRRGVSGLDGAFTAAALFLAGSHLIHLGVGLLGLHAQLPFNLVYHGALAVLWGTVSGFAVWSGRLVGGVDFRAVAAPAAAVYAISLTYLYKLYFDPHGVPLPYIKASIWTAMLQAVTAILATWMEFKRVAKSPTTETLQATVGFGYDSIPDVSYEGRRSGSGSASGSGGGAHKPRPNGTAHGGASGSAAAPGGGGDGDGEEGDERTWLSLFGDACTYVWPEERGLQARALGCLGLLVCMRVVNLAVPILYKHVVDILARATAAAAASHSSHAATGGGALPGPKPHHGAHPGPGSRPLLDLMQAFGWMQGSSDPAQGLLTADPDPAGPASGYTLGQLVWPWIALYLTAVFFQGGAGGGIVGFINNVRSFLWIPVTQDAYRRISLRVFDHVMDMDLSFHLRKKTGEVTKVVDRGTNAMQNILSTILFSILPQIFDVLAAATYLAQALEPTIAIIVFVTVGSYIPLTIIITEWRGKLRREMNQTDQVKSARATDALLNYETVKYFTNEKHESCQYAAAIAAYQSAEFRSQSSINVLNVVQSAIMFCGISSGLVVCAAGVSAGSLTVGDAVLFLSLMAQLYGPLNFFGSYYRTIQQYMIDMENLLELLNRRPGVTDSPTARELVVGKGEVSFDDVSFQYEEAGQVVLRGVSFRVTGGKTLALVGATGSGKSTITRLVFRFYDVASGAVRVDGQDVRSVTQASLRRADTVLFNDTILHNIRYGNLAATDEQVFEVARLACIHDTIVNRFPKGYDTIVGERGLRLSGGEKQRVAFARALLKNPAILVLDEATSALDTITEKKIQTALAELRSERTTIIVAHRLSTIADADLIVVMAGGKVAQSGSHSGLLAEGGLYADMWARQAAAAEKGEPLSSGGAGSRIGSTADLTRLAATPPATDDDAGGGGSGCPFSGAGGGAGGGHVRDAPPAHRHAPTAAGGGGGCPHHAAAREAAAAVPAVPAAAAGSSGSDAGGVAASEAASAVSSGATGLAAPAEAQPPSQPAEAAAEPAATAGGADGSKGGGSSSTGGGGGGGGKKGKKGKGKSRHRRRRWLDFAVAREAVIAALRLGGLALLLLAFVSQVWGIGGSYTPLALLAAGSIPMAMWAGGLCVFMAAALSEVSVCYRATMFWGVVLQTAMCVLIALDWRNLSPLEAARRVLDVATFSYTLLKNEATVGFGYDSIPDTLYEGRRSRSGYASGSGGGAHKAHPNGTAHGGASGSAAAPGGGGDGDGEEGDERTWLSLFGDACAYVWPEERGLQARALGCLGLLVCMRVVNLAVPILYKHVVDILARATAAAAALHSSHAATGGGALPGPKPHHGAHPGPGSRPLLDLMQAFGWMQGSSDPAQGLLTADPDPAGPASGYTLGQLVWPWIALYLTAVFFQGGAGGGIVGFINNVRSFLWIPVTQDAYRRISLRVFDHVMDMDLSFHLRKKTGEVTKVVDRGTNAMQNILSTILFSILPQIFDVLAAATYLAQALEPTIAIIVFVTVKSARATDALLNYETVKYFTNEKHESCQYAAAIAAYQSAEFRSQSSINVLNVVQSAIMFCGISSGLVVCAAGVSAGSLTVGDAVLFLSLMAQLYGPLNFFGSYYRTIQQYMIDMENLLELLNRRPGVTDSPTARELVVGKGEVSFDDVSFQYEEAGQVVLRGVSFRVTGGKTLALVGATGSGKSTITRLVFRFYDVASGAVRVDGQDVRSVTQASLRRAVGMVPQDTVLFNDTILHNIRYGNLAATDEQVFEVARLACIHDTIVNRFPKGYDTIVGERGLRLSGGEKQRVAFARALLKNPAILVLDEATSALDTITEKKIQTALAELRSERTTIIVAHRLSTIADADLIVVMAGGKVAQTGSHSALLAEGGLYADMWARQAAAAEKGEPLSSGGAGSRIGSAADLTRLAATPPATDDDAGGGAGGCPFSGAGGGGGGGHVRDAPPAHRHAPTAAGGGGGCPHHAAAREAAAAVPAVPAAAAGSSCSDAGGVAASEAASAVSSGATGSAAPAEPQPPSQPAEAAAEPAATGGADGSKGAGSSSTGGGGGGGGGGKKGKKGRGK
ncbi:hypothetical protein HYH03_017887 [Edaphochlamys debaryana]|uniref:Uncharacterized protein n=1 Tax=Edaphochlamys debaryana TaxID=47281 RepID=A0A835XLJ4_9CHLO|nr:hypothetical protein HYH03_017887 [Edaphochlamys debaryana]|eukprot:KAG2483230.1 hypothetical protein HYH03_017887 [Edaphochlamys debaryana]